MSACLPACLRALCVCVCVCLSVDGSDRWSVGRSVGRSVFMQVSFHQATTRKRLDHSEPEKKCPTRRARTVQNADARMDSSARSAPLHAVAGNMKFILGFLPRNEKRFGLFGRQQQQHQTTKHEGRVRQKFWRGGEERGLLGQSHRQHALHGPLMQEQQDAGRNAPTVCALYPSASKTNSLGMRYSYRLLLRNSHFPEAD